MPLPNQQFTRKRKPPQNDLLLEISKKVANIPIHQLVVSPKLPVISKWRQNEDGSISGVIIGSTLYEDGEAITTSPVKEEAASGTVAVTVSGSR